MFVCLVHPEISGGSLQDMFGVKDSTSATEYANGTVNLLKRNNFDTSLCNFTAEMTVEH